jgi:Bacterial SH3 domain
VSWKVPLLACVMLTLTIPSLRAAETLYVQSESVPLNVRSGPGIDNPIVARLAHRTQVSLLERWSVWARITTPQGDAEGWVLQRYLTPDPPPSSESQTDMSADEEQRRFTRLQRKGIITIQRGDAGMLKLTINALIWRHLTPQEQHNFLQRAQHLFGSTSVDIYDHHTDSLLARLTGTGTFESLADSASSQTMSPLPPPTSPSPPPVSPR